MELYLIRVMTCEVKGDVFRNIVVLSRDLPSAVQFANRVYGSACVGSVEPVDTMSFLPKDLDFIGIR